MSQDFLNIIKQNELAFDLRRTRLLGPESTPWKQLRVTESIYFIILVNCNQIPSFHDIT